MRSSAMVCAFFALALFPGWAAADDPELGAPISASAPWARPAAVELRSAYARIYGIDPSEVEVESVWQGDMLFGPESQARSILEAQGLPVPALQYEASPGILYVAMNGVSLTPTCLNGDPANSALGCSPLVDAPTTFPAYGNSSQQAAVFSQLEAYYEAFDIVLTSERPPDWVPYTLAVVGGNAQQAGQGPGVCGIANVACDGLKRNHVSLTFPESCGSIADIAAQESSHNWGLEHVEALTDLLYPFANGGVKSFLDSCNAISDATGDGVTQCGHVHEVYCEAGAGEEQNSFGELLGVFGAREIDEIDPVVTEVFPPDGTVIGSDETVLISARTSENSNFLAAKWTWVEGLPPGTDSYTRCTNNTCDLDYNFGVSFDPNEANWDFLALEKPPAGTYVFKFEAADAYGNYVTRDVTVTVEGAAGEGDDQGDDGSGSAGGTGPGTSSVTAGDEGPAEGGGTGGAQTDDAGAEGDDGSQGCGCRHTGPGSPVPWVGLLTLFAGLRRRVRR